MVLGADPARPITYIGPAPPPAPAMPTITTALVGFILPGMIVTLVQRDNHPFIWWAFGAIPLAFSAGRLVLAVGSKVEK